MADQSTEERYQAAVERVYSNDRIQITWQPDRCTHFAACIRGSVGVFNPRRRPWIDVNAAAPELIAEIVARCPTGALHANWADGSPAETPPTVTTVTPTVDGPLFLHGQIQVRDRQGNVVREDVRVALCRCGHSKNKPFCDDSHYQAGFASNDPHLGKDPDDPDDLVR